MGWNVNPVCRFADLAGLEMTRQILSVYQENTRSQNLQESSVYILGIVKWEFCPGCAGAAALEGVIWLVSF